MKHESESGKSKEEVRSEKERKQTQRAMLLNFLKCKWSYANNAAYSKQFRLFKLLEMSNEITYFLYDESGQLSLDERYMLLSMIRYINRVIDLKDQSNKEALESHLERLDALTKRINKEV